MISSLSSFTKDKKVKYALFLLVIIILAVPVFFLLLFKIFDFYRNIPRTKNLSYQELKVNHLQYIGLKFPEGNDFLCEMYIQGRDPILYLKTTLTEQELKLFFYDNNFSSEELGKDIVRSITDNVSGKSTLPIPRINDGWSFKSSSIGSSRFLIYWKNIEHDKICLLIIICL